MGESTYRNARFWRKAQKLYPEVCASLGDKVGFFHDRYWWYATGHAYQVYQEAEADIREELRALFADTYSRVLYFRLYMIGRSAELAMPTIMFFCEDKEPRKKAKKVVDECGVLNKLPGFRTGHQASQPEIGTLIQPATEMVMECQRDSTEMACEV
jgi:hypothetical protein